MKLEFSIDLLIYMVFASGAILFFWNEIDTIFKRHALKRKLKAKSEKETKLPKLLEYCHNLIDVSFLKESSKRFFLVFECLLFIISYFLSYRNYSYLTALFISFLTIAFPFFILISKLENKRYKSSREGVSLISELHRQYCINNKNIYEAIDQTIKAGGNYANSGKHLYVLLMKMRTDNNPESLKESVKIFVFNYGTNWARMLGQCIYLAAYDGTDISAALLDLIDQLKEACNLEERRKMLNGEASRMTLFLVPLMYIVCMLTAVYYLHISPHSLFVNQFLNPSGFLLFLINTFLFLVNILLINFVNSGRLDI
ncbi:MAG: hypothetical protein Q4F55_04325 [Bacillota bacterium]|nr:hypothetical protein [Bacillota bacterium]